MSEIDKMAREILPDELCLYGYEVNDFSTVVSFSEALSAIRAALLTAPPGWKLVPEKITESMRNAWDSAPDNEDDDISFWGAYSAMIAAAPEPK